MIRASGKKTDRGDAEQLALYLEKGMLPEVRMKAKQQRELQHLTETRELLVKQRSALKGKINNLLATFWGWYRSCKTPMKGNGVGHCQTGQQTRAHRTGAVRPRGATLQPVSRTLL